MTREENIPLLCSVLCEDLRSVWTSLVTQMVKNLPAMRETWVQYLSCEDPQYSCVENPYGQRSLEGYSPWGHKELDTIERLSTHWPQKFLLVSRKTLELF